MATIHNSELSKELTEGAKIQISRDKIPNELAEKVVPVMEVNPKLLRRAKGIATMDRTTTTAASPGTSIVTLNQNKDTYITSIVFANSSDVNCDNTIIRIRATDEFGSTIYLIRADKITLTATNSQIVANFDTPIKLQRGSVIYYLNAFTVGASITGITIFGYENEVINA